MYVILKNCFFKHQNSGTFLHKNLLYLHCISSVPKPYYFKICRLFYWVVTKLLNYLALDFMLMISFHASLKKTDKAILLDLFLNEKIIGSKVITLGLTSLLFVSTFSLVFWSSMIDNTFFFVTEFWRTEVHVKAHTQSTYGNIPAWPQMSQNLFTIISSSSDCLLCP